MRVRLFSVGFQRERGLAQSISTPVSPPIARPDSDEPTLLRWNRPPETDGFNVAFADASRGWSEARNAEKAALKALDAYRIGLGVASEHGREPITCPSFPTVATGLFSGAARPEAAPVPRANWTDEQHQEEGRLKAAAEAAEDTERAASEALGVCWQGSPPDARKPRPQAKRRHLKYSPCTDRRRPAPQIGPPQIRPHDC